MKMALCARSAGIHDGRLGALASFLPETFGMNTMPSMPCFARPQMEETGSRSLEEILPDAAESLTCSLIPIPSGHIHSE
jgi:hypothetical protein